MLTRRQFVTTAVAAPLGLSAGAGGAVGRGDGGRRRGRVRDCARGLRNGMRVVLAEETDWIGGQLTSQAVPPDEHPYIESFGCTQAYREYRNAVRDYYR